MNQQMLDAWGSNGEGLAVELAQEGRDVWEIEITGGDIAENESSLDYTYNNLVEDYFPALIGAVQYYTGEITTDYVGHSNGCRVALSSLNNYQESGLEDVGVVTDLITGNSVNVDLQASPSTPVVDTFVGVACPAELNGHTILSFITRDPISSSTNNLGDSIMGEINLNHLTIGDYAKAVYNAAESDGAGLMYFFAGIFGKDKISWELMKFYNDLSVNTNSNFDLSNLDINKLRLYNGKISGTGNDYVVPIKDMQVILDQKGTQDWSGLPVSGFTANHVWIKNREDVKRDILEDLK